MFPLDVAEDMLVLTAYKGTRVADIVCKRQVRLYRDRLLTLHSSDSATNSEKVWFLSSSCRLEPEYTDELVSEQRLVRPAGSWSVTTKAFSSGQPIELYCVTIQWPTSWLATRGYTSFTLGFETRQEAVQWHSHVQKRVSSMRLRSGSNVSKGDPSATACHSSKPSYDDRNMQWSGGGTAITRKPSQDKGLVAAVLEHWLGSREDKATCMMDEADGSGNAQQYRMPTSPVQIPISSRPGSAPPTIADADAADCADVGAHGQQTHGHYASSDGSCSSQDYAPVLNLREERWVPYRHTNGVAIYHQRQTKCSGLWGDDEGPDAAAGLGVGSEYMASSIVRGSPDECLAVLMDMASNTTILGPASTIELLEDADERQVLRIVVEATGMARRLCAPREVTVERVFKREECGVDVILFSSYQTAANTTCGSRKAAGFTTMPSTAGAASSSSSRCSNLPVARLFSSWAAAAAAAAVCAAGAAAFATGGTAAAIVGCMLLSSLVAWLVSWRSAADVRGGSSRSWRQWLATVAEGGPVMWCTPVWATVQGGYTISPREDAISGHSPESLVTCILKVELGGWLGECSWLRPFADALGWVDAYVERMLMAVILVKDEVEQRKFMVQPFSLPTGASWAALGRPSTSPSDAAAGLQEATLSGGAALQQRQHAQRQLTSSRLRHPQQHGSILDTASLSLRWQLQQLGSHRQHDGGYGAYGIEQQQQQQRQGQHVRRGGEQQLGVGPAGVFDIAGRQQQQAKQKGRLGRMASRIYAMRPKLLRGSSADRAQQVSNAQPPDSLYKESISFNSHITARPADASSPGASEASQHTGLPELGGAGAAAAGAADLSDPQVLLASVGLPADTQVVQPEYYMGGPQGPAARDATLNSKFWRELHTPGTSAPFKLRGASYLEDRQKVDGGVPQFVLGSVDLVETPGPMQHISRFLPQVRGNQAGYSFVVNLIIPGTPVLSLVAVFINEHHPDILDAPAAAVAAGSGGTCDSSNRPLQQLDVDGELDVPAGMPQRSGNAGVSRCSSSGRAQRSGASAVNGALRDDDATEGAASEGSRVFAAADYQRPADTSDWQPFDHALHRFLHGDDATRTSMFKLIPHIAEGSWVIKQSVGTVPVILGNKLKTMYYQTDRYVEACCDVTSSSAAAYITGMVRGATKSLVIDLGFVLEGQRAEELPEALLGAFRLNHLDCTTAQRIDTSRELPLLPRPLQHHQLVALQQQAQEQLAAAGAAGGGGGAVGAASAGTLPKLPHGAAARASGGAGQQEQQQADAQGGEQQQLDSHHYQGLAQRLQQRCRNSLPAVEGARTMTGHARSRSAASVEELVCLGSSHGSSSPRAVAAPYSAEQRTKPSSSLSPSHTQQPPSAQQQQHRHSSGQGVAGLMPGGGQLPPSIRTSTSAGIAATPLPAAAPADSSVSGGSALGATPAKQLFSNFLSFTTGGDKGSGGRGSAAAGDTASAAAAAAAAGSSTALPHAYGDVSSLSVAATPAGTPPATGDNTPNAAAAAAGSLLGTMNSVGSVSARSASGMAAPNVAAAGVRGHHRTSSNSDCKTPAAAAVSGVWPASPPTGSADWSSKLSAAAYISRAHAAALAASAARRSGGQQHHQHSSSSCPNNVTDAATIGADAASAAAYLPTAPDAARLEGDAAAGWLSKHPRTSSSGSAVIWEHQQQQQQQLGSANVSATSSAGVAADVLLLGQGSSNLSGSWGRAGSGHAGGGGGGGGGAKITASEQLRLAKQQQQQQQQQQAPAQGFGFRSIWGSGSQVPSSNGSLSVLSGGRQASAGGAAGRGAAVSGSCGSPPQQQKRRFSHRRFASLPVNGSA